MIRACPECGKSNRVPAKHLADQGKCGSCSASLSPVDVPFGVGSADFESILANATVPVLVDFWAPWCGPCKAAAPILEKIATELKGRALIVKVNTDEEGALAAKYGARGIPHFVVLKDGAPIAGHTGLRSEEEMRGWLTDAGA